MEQKSCEQKIKRYFQILIDYQVMANKIENCASDDKDFYRHICLLFAQKMQDMQIELTDQGFVLCQRSSVKKFTHTIR